MTSINDAKYLRWSYGWSPSKKKAFIVDSKGFTIIGAILSAQAAAELCRQHNSAIGKAIDIMHHIASQRTAA